MSEQPTPEAVEAVGMLLFAAEQCDRRQQQDLIGNWEGRLDDRDRDEYRAIARDFTEFIRDAIHRDGPDADAIREALGLATETRSRASSVDAGPCNNTCGLVMCGPDHRRTRIKFGNYRRVVGEWQDATSVS